MNKRHPHNNIIERKLEQLSPVDADHLWNDMHSILDKKMPQKKERRRFIVGWFLSGKGLLLLSVVVFISTGSSLFFLSTKESSLVTIEKLPGSSQSDKLIEDGTAKGSSEGNGTAKGSSEGNENITTASEPNKKTVNEIATAARSSSAVDQVINNSFITEQTKKQSKKYIAKEQFNQAIPGSEKHTTKNISKPSANFDIAPVTLESIHQGLIITTNNNKFVSPQLEPVTRKVMKTNISNSNESGFYAGIISGVDLSSIRFKSVRTGATKGFIIGYAFNKKWSIESGLLWDTKRVYDDGKNFYPPGYTPTNGITIVDVNGKSRLYELPVTMKYTIISGKHSLFTTTGLSSYIMRSENYDYEYEQNGQPGGHNYLSYTNATKNWFSVVNFSVGYTHKLSNIGSIRVEPYLKLPLKNLGVGNMPITSTGLNVGFTKPLRR